MRFALLISLASSAALVSASSLAQNVLCGDSGTCAQRCGNGAFHIVQDDSKNIFFGCSQKANEYNVLQCGFGGSTAADALAKSRVVCEAAGGRFCPRTFLLGPPANNCIMFALDSKKFNTACEGDKGTPSVGNTDLPYDIAVLNCPNS